jgi:SAM-dependent methyltransferase
LHQLKDTTAGDMRDFRQRIVEERFVWIADKYYAEVSDRRSRYNSAVDRLIRQHVLQRGGSGALLDVGCGRGTRPLALHKAFPMLSVTGLDASPSMAEAARGAGLPRVIEGSVTDLPFATGSFDVVTCLFFVICYVMIRADRKRAAAELYRVLKPGCHLFIDAINLWHVGESMEFYRAPRDIAFDLVRSLVDPRLDVGDKLYQTVHDGKVVRGIHHAFTPKNLERLLTGAGFEIAERRILGYNSGEPRGSAAQGQIVLICRKPV